MTYEATSPSSRTVTAFFDNRTDADEAVNELVSAGVSMGSIRLVPGSEGGQAATTDTESGSGFWESLKDLFMPDEDRDTYAEGLRRGGYLVTVTAEAANYDTVVDILDDEGTVDISERESAWRAEGWTGYSHASGTSSTNLSDHRPMAPTAETGFSSSSGPTARSANLGAEEAIPVAEEQLRVGKRDVSHGRVRIRSYVVETPVTEDVSLREERVHVESRPVDRPLTGDEQLFQDRTIEVEERGEEAVVAKEARVKEELVVKKDVADRTETISDTVRHTEIDVEDERKGLSPSERNLRR